MQAFCEYYNCSSFAHLSRVVNCSVIHVCPGGPRASLRTS